METVNESINPSINPDTLRKTALYVYSDSDNADESVQQSYALEQYADEHNLRNLRQYCDDSANGSPSERPALAKLTADIANDKVSVLLVMNLSRLGSMDRLLALCGVLSKHHVRLIAINDTLNRAECPMQRELLANGIHYTLHGDYYLPDLLSAPNERRSIGRWGWQHLCFLRENQQEVYHELLNEGKLYPYLIELNQQAEVRHAVIMSQLLNDKAFIESQHFSPILSAETLFNTIYAIADEFIMTEMICS